MQLSDALYILCVWILTYNRDRISKYLSATIPEYSAWLYGIIVTYFDDLIQQRAEIVQKAYSTKYEALYQPLPVKEWETRILHVRPAKNLTDPVICELKVVRLGAEDDPGNYVALSYTWGDEKPTWRITCNGVEVRITKSCRDAIQALRFHKHERIWIDQVCINQQSLPERGQQVTMMGLIYGRAASVFVFLGWLKERAIIDEPRLGMREACAPIVAEQALQRVQDRWNTVVSELRPLSTPASRQQYVAGFSQSIIHTPHARASAALAAMNSRDLAKRKALREWVDEMVVAREIFKHRYFERKWIIQEIALNRTIKLLIGSYCMDVEILASLSTEMVQALTLLREQSENANANRLFSIIHPDSSSADFGRKFANFSEIFSYRTRLHENYEPQDPIETISKFSDFVTTVPVDSVYALRAMLPNLEAMPRPDYTLDTSIVYLQHTNWLVQNNWGARMLSSARLLLENSDIYPSWTIDFQSASMRRQEIIVHGSGTIKFTDYLPPLHHDDDKSWGLQERHNIAFMDCTTGKDVPLKDLRPCGTERISPSVRMVGNPQLFCADGFVLDTIEAIEPSATFRPGWPELVAKKPQLVTFFQQRENNRTREVQQFIQRAAWWETIVQKENEITSSLYNTSPFLLEKALYYLAVSKHHGVPSTMENVERCFGSVWADTETLMIPAGIAGQVASVSDMKFAVTKDGWLGLVPKTAQVGDEIVFFHGVKTPFVLCAWANGRCRLRGRAHMLSLMWWWDWTYKLEASKRVKTFEIV